MALCTAMSAFGGKADISFTNVRFACLKQICSVPALRPSVRCQTRSWCYPGAAPLRFERDTFTMNQKILSKSDAWQRSPKILSPGHQIIDLVDTRRVKRKICQVACRDSSPRSEKARMISAWR